MDTLKQLEMLHLKSIERTNWRENSASLKLKAIYDKTNKIIKNVCYECGSLSNITCQYH